MTAFEQVCVDREPALVIVGGDVNSTLACALAAAKLDIPVAHIEAGLRSFDRSMPEEINRVLTDHVAELLFTTEPSGDDNLLKEGIPAGWIHLVGNCMIDSLRSAPRCGPRPQALGGARPATGSVRTGDSSPAGRRRRSGLARGVPRRPYGRSAGNCRSSFRCIHVPARGWGLPEARRVGARPAASTGRRSGWWNRWGTSDFVGLMAEARLVLTDSGGVQEETTALESPA